MTSASRQIALIAFDDVQVLDVTGPAAVFGAANDAAMHRLGRPFYRVHILSPQGGPVTSNCGLAVVTAPLASVKPAGLDTVLVAGGSKQGLPALARDAAASAWLRRACARARRYGSVCTGAFALDVAGLAERAGMSPRTFHRRFTDALGETPARFVETLRLDHARTLLQTALALKTVVTQTGYATPAQLSKAFARRFGVSPGLFRAMHHDAATP